MCRTAKLTTLALLCLLLSACKIQLYSGLSERDANEITGTLLEHGVAAQKTEADEKTWRVMIDEADFARSVAILREGQFPAHASQGLGEVFRKDGLVSSPVEERARLIYALSQELSRTLSRIDGVIEARVHVMIPPAEMLSEQQKPSSASVFIKHRREVDIATQVPQIKALVLNGVEGARYDTISVALFPAELGGKPVASLAPAPTATANPGLLPSSPWFWLLVPLAGLCGLLAQRWWTASHPQVTGAAHDPYQR